MLFEEYLNKMVKVVFHETDGNGEKIEKALKGKIIDITPLFVTVDQIDNRGLTTLSVGKVDRITERPDLI